MYINVTGFSGLIVLVPAVWARISVIGSNAPTGRKLVWVPVILFLPVIGFIAGLVLGPRAARAWGKGPR